MLGDIRIDRVNDGERDYLGRMRLGSERVTIIIDDADGTPDRQATVQAITDLLEGLFQRERDADEAQRKARADKAKAARLRAEADKLDPHEFTELDQLHVKISMDTSEIECNCCSCRSVERVCCHCGRFDDD